MWTDETIKKAAEEYTDIDHKYSDVYTRQYVIDIFLAGAKYIINNTQS